MSLGDQHSTAGSHGPREERQGARTIAGRLLAAATLFLLSGGCSSITNSKIAFSEESMHGEDDVVVYLYREKHSVGNSDTWSVKIDDVVIGDLKQEAYMAIHLAPGFHAIKAPGNGFTSLWLAGVTSRTDGTKADRVYFPRELLQEKGGMVTPDGLKVGDMTYYAAPSRRAAPGPPGRVQPQAKPAHLHSLPRRRDCLPDQRRGDEEPCHDEVRHAQGRAVTPARWRDRVAGGVFCAE